MKTKNQKVASISSNKKRGQKADQEAIVNQGLSEEIKEKVVEALSPGFWHLKAKDESPFDIEGLTRQQKDELRLIINPITEGQVVEWIQSGAVNPHLHIEDDGVSVSLMHCAAQMGSLRILKALHEQGASIEEVTLGKNPRSIYEISLKAPTEEQDIKTYDISKNVITKWLRDQGIDQDQSLLKKHLGGYLMKQLSFSYVSFIFSQVERGFRGANRPSLLNGLIHSITNASAILPKVQWALKNGADNLSDPIGDASLQLTVGGLVLVMCLSYRDHKDSDKEAQNILESLLSRLPLNAFETRWIRSGKPIENLLEWVGLSESRSSVSYDIANYQKTGEPLKRSNRDLDLKDLLIAHYVKKGGDLSAYHVKRNKSENSIGLVPFAENPRDWGSLQNFADFISENNWPLSIRALLEKRPEEPGRLPVTIRERDVSIADESFKTKITVASLEMAKLFYGPESFRFLVAQNGDTPEMIMDKLIDALKGPLWRNGKEIFPAQEGQKGVALNIKSSSRASSPSKDASRSLSAPKKERSTSMSLSHSDLISQSTMMTQSPSLEGQKQNGLIQRLTLIHQNCQASRSPRVKAMSLHLLRTTCVLAMEASWDDVASFCIQKGVNPNWLLPVNEPSVEHHSPLIIAAIVKSMSKTIKAAWPHMDQAHKIALPLNVIPPSDAHWPIRSMNMFTEHLKNNGFFPLKMLLKLKEPELYKELEGDLSENTLSSEVSWHQKLIEFLTQQHYRHHTLDYGHLLTSMIKQDELSKEDIRNLMFSSIATAPLLPRKEQPKDASNAVHYEAFEVLSRVGAGEVEATHPQKTPLLAAVAVREFEMAAILLEAGADPMALDLEGNSVFHYLALFDQRGHQSAKYDPQRLSHFCGLLMRKVKNLVISPNRHGEMPSLVAQRLHSADGLKEEIIGMLSSLEESSALHQVLSEVKAKKESKEGLVRDQADQSDSEVKSPAKPFRL